MYGLPDLCERNYNMDTGLTSLHEYSISPKFVLTTFDKDNEERCVNIEQYYGM